MTIDTLDPPECPGCGNVCELSADYCPSCGTYLYMAKPIGEREHVNSRPPALGWPNGRPAWVWTISTRQR